MNNIGNRIRNRRVELGLSQTDLAKKLGYKSKAAISKIETNVADIPQKKLPFFAEALETTVPYLTGDAPEEAVSKTRKELLDLIQSLPEEQIQTLLVGLKTTLHK